MSASPKGGFRVGPDADPDRYLLSAAVASGAEGILYRGWITTATGLELDVAVKMLQPRFLARVEEWHARWSEQVEVLRSLQVPGVVRVRDGFLGPLPHPPGEAGEGRTLYLIMNWVEGEPLDEWARRDPDRDPFDALKVLLGVAVALDLMHSGRATGGVPVLHRDVKPSNILVTDEGTVLIDFGLTRGLPDGPRLSGVTGTPGYLAPEATEAGIYTPATDRYAFGAVAYFLLTGEEPPTSHQPEALRASLADVPASAARPEAIDHLMAMLDADPTARPTSLANWVGQLRRSSLAGDLEVLAPDAPGRSPEPALQVGRPPAHVWVERRMRQQRRFRLPKILHLVVVVALVTLGLGRPGPASQRDTWRPPAGERQVMATPQTTGQWQKLDPGPLATRGEAKAVWTGKEVLVVGGLAIEQYRAFSDGAAFDPVSGKWRPIPPRPTPGRVMSAVWTGEEVITFGTEGALNLDKLTSAAAYNPVTNQWRHASLPPSVQVPSDVVWTGSRVIAWQPEGASPGALYDPATDRWTPIEASSAPGTVSYGRAVWIGEELAIQSGVAPTNGGPVEQRLSLFHPDRKTWRVSNPVPESFMPWLSISPIWTGREVLFSAQTTPQAMKTYAYDPKANGWREMANPPSGDAPGYYEGVRLDDGRVVVGGRDPNNPLLVLDPATGRWSGSGPAPGPLPTGTVVSIGSSVFLWGAAVKDSLVQVRSPNTALLWSP